jgi:hypothetical protein
MDIRIASFQKGLRAVFHASLLLPTSPINPLFEGTTKIGSLLVSSVVDSVRFPEMSGLLGREIWRLKGALSTFFAGAYELRH